MTACSHPQPLVPGQPPHLQGLSLLLPFLVRTCCLILGHDLKPQCWTCFPQWQKAEGSRLWSLVPRVYKWWQPRQMIWTEREIHPPPPPEEKQKGHHGNCSVLD